jgi:SAM-dependent methyltransferase
METHLAIVRTVRRWSLSTRSTERRLRGLRDIKLHFGCGTRILPDWVNIDGWAVPGTDLVTDLRQPLPFSDASCRVIFTEHVFEHIEIDARRDVLQELYRILAPDGTLRIVVPDCRLFVDAYVRGDLDWFKAIGFVDASTPAAGLNSVFSDHFHRFVDDFDSLAAEIRAAGFSRVERSSLNASTMPELQIDSEELSRTLCSLYLEARP